MLNDIIDDLKEKWDLTDAAASDIKEAMAGYAFCALNDFAVKQEVMDICYVEFGD